jgi:hypothetical protein
MKTSVQLLSLLFCDGCNEVIDVFSDKANKSAQLPATALEIQIISARSTALPRQLCLLLLVAPTNGRRPVFERAAGGEAGSG